MGKRGHISFCGLIYILIFKSSLRDGSSNTMTLVAWGAVIKSGADIYVSLRLKVSSVKLYIKGGKELEK